MPVFHFSYILCIILLAEWIWNSINNERGVNAQNKTKSEKFSWDFVLNTTVLTAPLTNSPANICLTPLARLPV